MRVKGGSGGGAGGAGGLPSPYVKWERVRVSLSTRLFIPRAREGGRSTPRPVSPQARVKPKSVSRIDAFVPPESPRAPLPLTRPTHETPPTSSLPGTLREDRQGEAGQD